MIMISIYLDFQHLVDEGDDKLCLRSITHVVLMLFRMAVLLSGAFHATLAERGGGVGAPGLQPRTAGAVLSMDGFPPLQEPSGKHFSLPKQCEKFHDLTINECPGRTQPEPLTFYLSDKFHVDLEPFKTFHNLFSPQMNLNQ